MTFDDDVDVDVTAVLPGRAAAAATDSFKASESDMFGAASPSGGTPSDISDAMVWYGITNEGACPMDAMVVSLMASLCAPRQAIPYATYDSMRFGFGSWELGGAPSIICVFFFNVTQICFFK